MNNRSITGLGAEPSMIRLAVAGLLCCVLLWAVSPAEAMHKAFEPLMGLVADTGPTDNLDTPPDLLVHATKLSVAAATDSAPAEGLVSELEPPAFATPPVRAPPALA